MKDHRIDFDLPQLAESPRSLIAHRLQDAIEELRADVARVELWASALASFTEPVPDYSPQRRLAFDRMRTMAANAPAQTPAEEA